ncbi:coiled-coil domain-containing protein 24 isoform X2 [Antechinus flavipes]|uniref:coiled-coil domain-containing protein 24 isoform X2 n=1 Tax=Antechinus flavipes TaxID=38775 RepID=UPI002235F861|nr:coiled-coil domain-containing protein 24 isoform X2 [Antechinus flavipes]
MPLVPRSLWGLVEQHVQPPERAEVKRILGEAAVDLSLELRSEVEILEALLEEECQAACGAGPSSHSAPFSFLTPPPRVRDLVRRELRLLLNGLQHKAELEGRDTAKAWVHYSPRVLRFALGDPRNGLEEELEARLPGTGALSSSQDLSAIKDCLNVANIDQVIQHLRTLLKEECCALERKIKALQRCLENVHNSVAESSLMLEPTLAELKEQKKAMEQELQGPPTPVGPCHSWQGSKSQDAGWQKLGRQRMLLGRSQDLPFSGQQPQESRSCGLLPALSPAARSPKPPWPRASGTYYYQSRWGRRLQARSHEGPLTSGGPHAGTPS